MDEDDEAARLDAAVAAHLAGDAGALTGWACGQFEAWHKREHARQAKLEADSRRDAAVAAYLRGDVEALSRWACERPSMAECVEALTERGGLGDPAAMCRWLRERGGCPDEAEAVQAVVRRGPPALN